MMFEEKNAYASIGYALYSLTSYVFSENPIKYKTKIKGESEKQDKMDLQIFGVQKKILNLKPIQNPKNYG